MKKIFALVLALMFLVSVAYAESAAEIALELKSMTTEELHFLKRAINAELVNRSENKTGEDFTVEHNEEYYETRQYIFDFLKGKGYEVQTILGSPNIGRYEDNDTTDSTIGWYAYLKHNGEWKEFVVVLRYGEVSGVIPKK